MNPRLAPKWIVGALAVALTAGVLLFACLGSMPFSDRDEGEYAASVAEMRRSGDYFIPRLNGQLYLEKPILIFWAVAAGQGVFGVNELGARFPSALSAWLLTVLLGLVVWRATGQLGWGVLSSACFAFSPLVVLVGRAVLTDMLLTLFTTLSLLSFYWANEKNGERDLAWYLGAWAFLALGFLTKGPVALAVVLPTAFLYALISGRLGPVLRRARIHWGLLVFVAINLPWYGWAFYQLGDKFWQGFFVSQNLVRFSEVLLGHGGGFFYYLPILLLGLFPAGALAWPGMFTTLIKRPRQAAKVDAAGRLRLLSALGALWTFLVFSLAATKQINYLLPAAPFVAVLAGDFLSRVFSNQAPATWTRRAVVISLGVLTLIWVIALLAIPMLLPHFWDMVLASIRFDSSEYALTPTAPGLGLWPWLAALGLGAGAVLAWLVYRRERTGLGVAVLLATAVLFSALTMGGLLGRVSLAVQDPVVHLAKEVRAVASTRKVAMLSYGLWKPSLLYYLDRRMRTLWVRDPLPRGLFGRVRPTFVFSRVRLADRLAPAEGFRELARAGGYLLGGNAAAAKLWQERKPR